MKLRDVEVSVDKEHERYRDFNSSTHCVTAFYLKNIDGYNIPNVWKVIINVDSKEKDSIKSIGGVMKINIGFKYHEYWNHDELGRRKMVLNVLHYGMIHAAKEYKLPIDKLDKAYKQIEDNNYQNERYWGKGKKSPNRKLVAQLLTVHDNKNINLFVEVRNNKKDSKRFFLTHTEPHEYFLVDLFGKLFWKGNDTVILEKKNKIDTLVVNISDFG